MRNKLFKNLIFFAVIIAVTIISSSCKNSVDLTVYVSELRSGIYECESDEFTLTVLVEEREDPFIADGFVGTIKKVLTVKLEPKNHSLDNAIVSLSFDGYNVEGDFIYSPISGKYVAEIFTQKLPETPTISATIKSGENSYSLEVKTKVVSGNLSYTEILEKVREKDGKRVDELFNTTNVCTEIHIRLISEKNKNYYYVGFTNKSGKIYAYLVDAKTGEILAEKSN